MKKNGTEYGSILKDKYEGKVVDEWNEEVGKTDLKPIDVTLTISKSLKLKILKNLIILKLLLIQV